MMVWVDKIGYLQIVDNLCCGELGIGEINYDFIFNVIKQFGYDGWVGCEYKLLIIMEVGLLWINQYC